MKFALKILLLGSGLLMTAHGLFGPIYAIFVERIGGDLLTAGSAYSIYSIAAGLMIFFVSRWSLSEKHPNLLITAGYGLSTVGLVGYSFITTPIDLFIVEVIFGVAEAISMPAFDGLFSSLIEEGKYANRWGLWETMAYLVTAFAAIAGGFIAQVFGFKFLFMVMAIVGFGSFLTCLGLFKKGGIIRFLNVQTKRR